ncbi:MULTISPECIES: nitrate- and nitrite sensing domain-containing protein [Thermomonospora]|uniref:histidine kinase n=1 Tax=Thermomonospora curvata (strain ATCC 19995 / DSM 43183 / JCM 3096 / KCTC 9072 / NBRC 15933 / NCIMB 10081 / Henssen B9) TaxID=471852 RepID=D1ACE3_THECD|nr:MULTISPECIES: nitrate- and nitrite sensing domain-containing protein [Thermomonospora]ACY99202.1 histidine kinase [Thermomonospora curvata DSM 43183]
MTSRRPPTTSRSSRTQSIRTKIIILLAIPLASLAGLWVLFTAAAIEDARGLRDSDRLNEQLVRPAIMLMNSLQHERRMSVAYVGDRTRDRAGLEAQRAKTDQFRRAFSDSVAEEDVRARLQPEVLRRIDQVTTRLSELEATRRLIDRHELRREQVMADYGAVIDGLLGAFRAVTVHDGRIARDLQNLALLSRARELVAREDALVTGVLAAGRWSAAEMEEFHYLVGAKNQAITEAVSGLPAEERAAYEGFLSGADYTRFQRLEERLLETEENSRRLPLEQGSWLTISEIALTRMSELESQAAAATSRRTGEVRSRTYRQLAGVGGLGLLALVLSTVVGWRIGNRLIRESRRVSRAMSDFTTRQLPALRDMVREGGNERIDPQAALPEQDLRTTEIARISHAFTQAGRAVLEAAAREIETRRAINEVFVTLARRNQALVHRQLTLLDTMERRAEDPDELDDLFRLDHLATRMRRHAENLIILAGRTAGRTWRNPVPLVDVVRGAVAEVEDYTRVNVLSMPAAALVGSAVADTIHLLAELIENATLFSPPTSPVQVTGQLVPNGFAVEIEDRGLGLKPETLEELNRRLAEPPEFDLSDLGRLGLFVVARLAERHRIKVSLRASPYGGTTAVVLVPADLIVESPSGALPPAELRAQLPGSTPGRSMPQLEQTAPAVRAASDPARPVQEVASVSLQERTGPQAVAADDDQVPAELPRRRRTTERSTGPIAVVTGAEPGEADASAASPRPAGEGSAGTASGGALNGAVNGKAAPLEYTADGLPRRRRQQHLPPGLAEAESLRQESAEAAGAQPTPPAGPAGSDGQQFEVVRDRMAAMQRGWQRGRAEAHDDQGTQEDGR